MFADILFGIYLANKIDATYVFDDVLYSPTFNTIHGTYPGFFEYLNMADNEHLLSQVKALPYLTKINATWEEALRIKDCNTVMSVKSKSCLHKMPNGTVIPDFCTHSLAGSFQSVQHAVKYKFLYSRRRKLLQRTMPLAFRGVGAYNIAWHIRSGDIHLHQDDRLFFLNICDTIKRALDLIQITGSHYIFCEHCEHGAPKGYEFLANVGDFTFVGGQTLVETLHNFVNADLVVETGSSMTAVVHAITGDPVFVSSCPKEGCHVQTYDIDTLVKFDDQTGRFSMSHRELASLIAYKRTIKRQRRQLSTRSM